MDAFEKLKEWTDLGNWLQKTAKYLETYPTKYIPRRKILSKRLSQCLNESLPIGIHRTTINIYMIILDQMKNDQDILAKNIALYSFGLFPFFPRSSLQIKPDVIEIFKSYYLVLGLEIVPLLTGFCTSLLSGMEEQDDNIQKMIGDILNSIHRIVGSRFFISTLWYILLKNSKNRGATFKIMFKKFTDFSANGPEHRLIATTAPKLQEIEEGIAISENKFESYVANIDMVANALIECLFDEDISTKKNCLDFMIKHLDISKYEGFNEEHIVSIYSAIISLFCYDDLSLTKRIFKLVFDSNDTGEIVQNEFSERSIDRLSNGFILLLQQQNFTRVKIKQIFKILKVITKTNKNLMTELGEKVSLSLIQFIHQWGYDLPNDFNGDIVEGTNDFIQTQEEQLPILLESFEKKINISNMVEKGIQLIEFVIKVIVVNGELPLDKKFTTTLQLMDKVFEQMDHQFEKQLNHELDASFSDGDINLQLQKNIQLLAEGTSYLEQLIQQKEVVLSKDIKQRIFEIEEGDSLLFERLLLKVNADKNLIEMYEDIFKVLMKIELLQKNDESINAETFQGSDLPQWLKSQFVILDAKTDAISYHALKFIYGLFELEEKYPLIKSYNQFIYQTKLHYQRNQICERILEKIIDFIQVDDYKTVCLSFLQRLLKLNINFVSRYLRTLLSSQSSQEFKKISILWNTTSHYNNTDCRTVLHSTVFDMLKFCQSSDPVVKHYFKNWLTLSQNNFVIILEAILKDIVKFTNWKVTNGIIYYCVPFDTAIFESSLANLINIYNFSSQVFLHFVIESEHSSDFDYYEEELKILLEQHFNVVSNKLIFFILKILLRYIIGEPEKDDTQDEALVQQHMSGLASLKEALCHFIGRLIENISDNDLLPLIVLPLIVTFSKLWEKQLRDGNLVLQLCYLNFLQFLLFKTNITQIDSIRPKMALILSESHIVQAYVLSLTSNTPFAIKEFVKFGSKLNLLITAYYKHPALTQVIRTIFASIMMSIQQRNDKTYERVEEDHQRQIISILLKAIKHILQFFLEVNEVQLKTSSSATEKTLVTIFTLGIVQLKDSINKKAYFTKDENTCKDIIQNFENMFTMLIHVWKKSGTILSERLYEQNQLAKQILSNKNSSELFGQSKHIFKIFSMLQNSFFERVLEGLLSNWFENNQNAQGGKISQYQADQSNSKILEILFIMNITPIKALSALQASKQYKNLLQSKRYDTIKAKKEYKLVYEYMLYECDILSFIYSFLNHQQQSDNAANFELYNVMLKILKNFDGSFTPITIAWILDILSVMVERFPTDLNKFYGLKGELQQFAQDVLLRAMRVIIQEQIVVFIDQKRIFKMNALLTPSIQKHYKSQKKNKQSFLGDSQLKRTIHYSGTIHKQR